MLPPLPKKGNHLFSQVLLSSCLRLLNDSIMSVLLTHILKFLALYTGTCFLSRCVTMNYFRVFRNSFTARKLLVSIVRYYRTSHKQVFLTRRIGKELYCQIEHTDVMLEEWDDKGGVKSVLLFFSSFILGRRLPAQPIKSRAKLHSSFSKT